MIKVQAAINSNFLLDRPNAAEEEMASIEKRISLLQAEEEEVKQIVEQPRPVPQDCNMEELS
jgi:ABC-type transport system involved in cytochrome bd biosynthesis fused ATPase/permease subunit